MRKWQLWKILILSAWVLSTGNTSQAETTVRHNIEIIPQYRDLEHKNASTEETFSDLFGKFSTHLEWTRNAWTIEAKPEVRAVVSKGVQDANPLNFVSVRTSDRVLDSRRTIQYEQD